MKAYTLVELLIVIGIVLIIAAAAVTGSRGAIKTMRFNSAFNKMVLIVQDARNHALTEKNQNFDYYGVRFTFTAPYIATFFGIDEGNDEQNIETFELDAVSQFGFHTQQNCTPSAAIKFEKVTAAVQLICEGIANSQITDLIIGLQELDGTRSKTFAVNSAAGILQID